MLKMLMGIDTFMQVGKGWVKGQTQNHFCLPSGKGSTLKGKNLLPLGANSFFYRRPLLRRGLAYISANRKSQNYLPVFLLQNGRKPTVCSVPLIQKPVVNMYSANRRHLCNAIKFTSK